MKMKAAVVLEGAEYNNKENSNSLSKFFGDKRYSSLYSEPSSSLKMCR